MSLNTTIIDPTYIKYNDNSGTPRLGFIINNYGDGSLFVGRLNFTDEFDMKALKNNIDRCILHRNPFILNTDVFAFEAIDVTQVTAVNPEWDQLTDNR